MCMTLYRKALTVKLSGLFVSITEITQTPDHFYSGRGFAYIRIYYSENIAVERYLSPVSGRRATIVLPLFSGRFAS